MSLLGYTLPIGLSGYQIRSAMEFHGDTYMHWTPVGGTPNPQRFTLSLWFKPAVISGSAMTYLLSIGTAPNSIQIGVVTEKRLILYQDQGGVVVDVRSNELVQLGEWQHIVYRGELDAAVQADRARLYLGGVECTYFSTTRPANQVTTWAGLFNSQAHYFGRYVSGGYAQPNGVIADVHLINGLSLGPDSFGFDNGGVWTPLQYQGPHGADGMRFEFKDSANLGLSTAQTA